MMSGIRFISAELEPTLTTGVIGLPVGVPSPVEKRIMLAPDPARAVVLSTSFPGVHYKEIPSLQAYSV